jgi:hypothetical protein
VLSLETSAYELQIAGTVMTVLVSTGVHHGYGLHLEDIQGSQDREQALMYTYLAPSISIVASTFGKVSMVLFLVRILGNSAKQLHLWFLYSVTFVMIGLNIFAIGILLGGCSPMQRAWIPNLPGTCINPNMLEYGGRIQASKYLRLVIEYESADCISLECCHGLGHRIFSRLYGLETPNEKEYQMGTHVPDVRRPLVSFGNLNVAIE